MIRLSQYCVILLTLSVLQAHAGQSNLQDLTLGRALYHGQQNFVNQAKVATVDLPKEAASCVSCHGVHGEGKQEAGILAPSIQWLRLLSPNKDGQAAYANDEAILGAIQVAKGRAGAINAPMPQFNLNAQEWQALRAYLKVIGTENEPMPGVTSAQITLGTLLPLTGSKQTIGLAIQLALQTRINQINKQGGLYGRTVSLQVFDTGSQKDVALQALARLNNQEIFAVIGSFAPEIQAETAIFAAQTHLPFIASLGIPLADTTSPYATYLLPSISKQAESLIGKLAEQCNVIPASVMILHTQETGVSELAQYLHAKFNLAAQEISEHQAEATAVKAAIVLSSATHMPALRLALSQNHQISCIGNLAVLSGQPEDANVLSSQSMLKHNLPLELIALPMPPISQNDTNHALQESELWSALADFSVDIVNEALSRAGRILQQDNLIKTLLSMQEYKLSENLTISYSQQKTYGVNVAYLWKELYHEPIKTTSQ